LEAICWAEAIHGGCENCGAIQRIKAWNKPRIISHPAIEQIMMNSTAAGQDHRRLPSGSRSGPEGS